MTKGSRENGVSTGKQEKTTTAALPSVRAFIEKTG
jgi:hypothetical protein